MGKKSTNGDVEDAYSCYLRWEEKKNKWDLEKEKTYKRFKFFTTEEDADSYYSSNVGYKLKKKCKVLGEMAGFSSKGGELSDFLEGYVEKIVCFYKGYSSKLSH